MISRRAFIAGLGAAVALPRLSWASAIEAKNDPLNSAFIKTGAFTVSVLGGTTIAGTYFATDTAVNMVSAPVVGQDYQIYFNAGALYAIDYATSPGGPVVGGFHYAAGSNATAWNTGGNATPQIISTSFWDVNWRPGCDPRGMVFVGDFWGDIYLLNRSHNTEGMTSKYYAEIAIGPAKPQMPLGYFGDGTTNLVPAMDWRWTANIYSSHRKRLMTPLEFEAGAIGGIEDTWRVVDPIRTGLNTVNNSGAAIKDEKYTSCVGWNFGTGSRRVWGSMIVTGQHVGSYAGGTAYNPSITPGLYPLYNGRSRGLSAVEDYKGIRPVLLGGPGSGVIDIANWDWSTASISGRGAADHHWQA
jgi:hypothetical protein